MVEILLVGSSMIVRAELVDERTRMPLEDATVEVRLQDMRDRDVPGVEWPLILPYVEELSVYQQLLPSTAEVKAFGKYWLRTKVTSPGGLIRNFETEVFAKP
jgi:hypothetical protein